VQQPIGGTVTKVSAALPDALHASLEQSARENDRSMSAELRRALAHYLASPSGSRTPESRPPSRRVGAGGSHPDRSALVDTYADACLARAREREGRAGVIVLTRNPHPRS
jgi:hypothetical protein